MKLTGRSSVCTSVRCYRAYSSAVPPGRRGQMGLCWGHQSPKMALRFSKLREGLQRQAIRDIIISYRELNTRIEEPAPIGRRLCGNKVLNHCFLIRRVICIHSKIHNIKSTFETPNFYPSYMQTYWQEQNCLIWHNEDTALGPPNNKGQKPFSP